MKLRSLACALGLAATAFAAQATTTHWATTLTPEAVGATGVGSAIVDYDDVSHVLSMSVNFAGLSGLTTQAHFHCCTTAPGTGTAIIAVDTPSLDVQLGVQEDSFTQSLDLDDPSNFNPAFITAHGGTVASALADFIAGLQNDRVYLNVHSTTFRGGEIRGFLQAPAPGSLPLALLACATLPLLRRRR